MTTRPTPETDALDQGLYGYSDLARVTPMIFALARTLERQRNEAVELLRAVLGAFAPGSWTEAEAFLARIDKERTP